jgi:formamidopyrimidine-DNA glycosylase
VRARLRVPELPEVESVRRGLVRARLRGPVRAVWRSRFALRIGSARADENLALLEGASAGRVGRRGKYLVWEFTAPRGEPLGLLVHLGMSGRFGIARAGDARVEHTHCVIAFDDDREVRLVDPRRFGALRAARLHELWSSPPLSELGPEPIDRDFTGACLRERAGASVRPLRELLLDQHVVAGIGNIYAIEALFRAKLHPLRRADTLVTPQWHALASALREVLRQAIDNGGTTLRDFRDVTGHPGRNQDELRVYGRAGAPCPRCGGRLRAFVAGGRGGVYCPREQRLR